MIIILTIGVIVRFAITVLLKGSVKSCSLSLSGAGGAESKIYLPSLRELPIAPPPSIATASSSCYHSHHCYHMLQNRTYVMLHYVREHGIAHLRSMPGGVVLSPKPLSPKP